MTEETRVVVIGLDGATFDLIYPWVEQGKLPNFKRFMDEGAHGALTSVIRPASPQAWSSFITGKNPGKHRINYFIQRKENSYDIRFINAKSRVGRSVWGILSDHGRRVGVMNVPITYPAEKVNGFMIAGMDAPGFDSNFAYPSGLYEEIQREVGEYILDSGMGGYIAAGKHSEGLKRLDEMITQRFKTAKYLYSKEDWDFFMVVFVAPDRVEHSFWRYMDPKHPLFRPEEHEKFGDAIAKTYVRLDGILGEFLEMVDDRTTIMVMSDHGMGPISDKTIYLNKWLASKWLLKFSGQKGGESGKGGDWATVRREVLRNLIRRVRRLLWARTSRKSKERLLKLFPGLRDKMMSMFFFSGIDMEQTKVFAEENRSIIWLNVKGRDPKGIVNPGREYEDLRDYVIKELEDLKCPYTGKKVVEKAYKREEIYCGQYVHEAADILVMWNGYTARLSHTSKGAEFIRRLSKDELERLEANLQHNAEHWLNGIFFARGPHVKGGIKLDNAHIMDLAPTILFSQGVPVPKDMDGKVLTDVFQEEFLEENPVMYEDVTGDKSDEFVSGDVYSPEESKTIEENLRGLGYIE